MNHARRLAFVFAMLASSAALAQITTLESIDAAGHQSSYRFSGAALSGGGRWVAFTTRAPLDPGDAGPGGRADVYVRNRQTGDVIWASHVATSLGMTSGGGTFSRDGRWIAYVGSTELGTPTPRFTIFAHDLETGADVTLALARDAAVGVALSANGRFAVFNSRDQANGICGDDYCADAVRLDRDPDGNGIFDEGNALRTRVSVALGGGPENGASDSPAISADGRFVAFTSSSSNLVAGDTNGRRDVFVRDVDAGQTVRASLGPDGEEGNDDSSGAAVFGGGRFVVFSTRATNFLAPDANGLGADGTDVWIRDLVAATSELVNVNTSGEQSDAGSTLVGASASGRFVAFASAAGNLDGAADARLGLFVRDRATGVTARVSLTTEGARVLGVQSAAISGDGLFVAFGSADPNVVPGDANPDVDVFVRDLRSCASGTVGAAVGPAQDVLHVNGAARFATVAVGAPIVVSLDAASGGPTPGGYALWVWRGRPANQYDLVLSGERIGCTEGATPFQPGLRPTAFRCLSGGLDASYCAGLHPLAGAPSSVPWSLTRAHGLGRAITFTLQGVVADATAPNASDLAVTNAVVLTVQ
jgi:Tol biopolymer transport system component